MPRYFDIKPYQPIQPILHVEFVEPPSFTEAPQPVKVSPKQTKTHRKPAIIGGASIVIGLMLIYFGVFSKTPTPITPGSSSQDSNTAYSATVATEPATTSTNESAQWIKELSIPSIGVKAEIKLMGVTSEGAMAVPISSAEVGLYKNGPKPGEIGNSVLAGHLNGGTNQPGVFGSLNKLKVGDLVQVKYNDSQSTLTFSVKDKQEYSLEQAPLDKIFGPTASSQLNLITCSGRYDKNTRDYTKRLVVFTELVK